MAKRSKKQQQPFSARFLNDFVEFTAGDIQKTGKTAMLFTLPAFSGMILHLLRCQGFGVAYLQPHPWTPWIYSTLGFCNVRVY
jgi:hypothetical protein